MFHALRIEYRAPDGEYATVTQLIEPGEIADYAAYIRAWTLENLPEGSQIPGAVVGWAPRPTVALVQRRLERLIGAQKYILDRESILR